MKTGWKTKGTGKGSLNLFLYTAAVCVKTAITQISQFLELWSTWSLYTGPYLSTAERQTWLQRVPSKEFFVIKRKKVSYLLSESPFKTNKPTSYSKPLRCDFRRCNELEDQQNKIVPFWACHRGDSLCKHKFQSSEMICCPAPESFFVWPSAQSCPDLRTVHKWGILHWVKIYFPCLGQYVILPSLYICRSFVKPLVSPCKVTLSNWT